MIELKSKVKDVVTGCQGVLVAKTYWANGCNRYGIQRPINKDGTIPDVYWADVQDVIIIKSLKKEKIPPSGGPMPNSKRNADPSR